MKIKFITSIYCNLYGTDLGGRSHRRNHYKYSLLSILKMTNADFLCYTSDNEIESLKHFFYIENGITEDKLKLEIFDLHNTKFSALINSIKNIDETKKSDRCIEIQYSKFFWWWNEDKSYDYYYWIDAGLSYNGLIPPKYLNYPHESERKLYESNLFNNLFLENLIAYTNDKFFILGKDNTKSNYWSRTVNTKWYTHYMNDIHIIGGLFGGHRDKWDNIVNLFENYVEKILSEDKCLPHEEQFMSLMFYNHPDLFIRKHFDIWWPCKEVAHPYINDDIFLNYKSFYKILEELNCE